MTTSDKIILGSTAVITASAVVMLMASKKYATAIDETLSELQGIHRDVLRSHDELVSGNTEINKSNQLLRKILIGSAEKVDPKYR